MTEEEQAREKRRKEWRDRVTAWGTAISAIGILAAFWQVWLVRSQIADDDDRTRRQVAIESIREWVMMQPPNAAACIELFGKFGQDQLKDIAARRPVEVPEAAREVVKRCFADQDKDHLDKLYDAKSGQLLAKGVSVFASRVDKAINADEVVALAAQHDIGDAKMIVEEMHGDITNDELEGVRRLRKILGHKYAWPAIPWLAAHLGETPSPPSILIEASDYSVD